MPADPPLPDHLTPLVRPDDPDWFALARHAVRVTEVAADEPDRPRLADPTRPNTAVAAFPGGRVPDDVP
jgi:hypothetical protein